MRGSPGGGRRIAGRVPASVIAVALAAVALAIGACGDDDDDDAGAGEVSLGELKTHLPAPDELGLKVDREHDVEADNANAFIVLGVNIPESSTAGDVGTVFEDAGFQGGVGNTLRDSPKKLQVLMAAAQFDSEEGALEARDAMHAEDLKQPCKAACVVTPREYELQQISDAAAVHHVPNPGKPPPGLVKFEAYHAEFVIDSELYVIQASFPPGWKSAGEFDEIVNTVYETASGA